MAMTLINEPYEGFVSSAELKSICLSGKEHQVQGLQGIWRWETLWDDLPWVCWEVEVWSCSSWGALLEGLALCKWISQLQGQCFWNEHTLSFHTFCASSSECQRMAGFKSFQGLHLLHTALWYVLFWKTVMCSLDVSFTNFNRTVILICLWTRCPLPAAGLCLPPLLHRWLVKWLLWHDPDWDSWQVPARHCSLRLPICIPGK